MILIWTDQFKSLLLESLDDFTNKSTLDTIGLRNIKMKVNIKYLIDNKDSEP